MSKMKKLATVLKIPMDFRATICKECNWSITMYNQKMKQVNLLSDDKLARLTDDEKRAIKNAMRRRFYELRGISKLLLI